MENAVLAHVGVGTPLLWGGFTLFVLPMLALDLGVFHRKAHAVGIREALGWSVFWIALATALRSAGVYDGSGTEKGLEFLTGYVIEKALSVDNIFVFLVILSYFSVPAAYQHRVLYYGILGALVLRHFHLGGCEPSGGISLDDLRLRRDSRDHRLETPRSE